ncbi:MAG: DUF885 domain-containing protein [Gammaproteobacteria bacterium]|nr:DUF885 domain-containing protein [Gammaproteobacteria bacterium]
MRCLIFSFLCGFALLACDNAEQAQKTTPAPSATVQKEPAEALPEETKTPELTESQRLNQWFEERYQEELAFSPISLTMQGRKERYAEIDDFSEAAADKQLDWKRRSVQAMQAEFDYALLDDETKTSWDLWEYQYQNALLDAEFRRQGYVFHQMHGMHSFIPTFMINFHRVESLQDMQDYISRLKQASRGIDQVITLARKNADAGVHAPRFAYDMVIEQVQKVISGKPFDVSGADSPLWADVKSKVQSLLDAEAIDYEQADSLRLQAGNTLTVVLQPAYKRLIGFLQRDYENTSEIAQGAATLPNGTEYYNYRLQLMTTTDMTADEIHALGLSEVSRLRAEMEMVKKRVGFKGSLQEFFVFQRDSKEDPRLYYQDSETGPGEYLADATRAIENIKKQLPNFFGILPKADLVVKRVESFREEDGAAQHYYPGTPDGSRPGIYYAHLSDMDAMPRNQLEVIAYHEGLPGHHMQIAIAQELKGIPTFRTQANATAYTEGWALYAELLAKEIPGTYADDYSEFGRLASEMFRAIRLVVDTGMHAKGWSQQQAVDYFSENSPEPLAGIESEVMRYLVIPGQATAYKVGMLKILQLRQQAEEALGDKFDIRGFHDAVLSGGALPLSLLERRVEQWVAGHGMDNG